MLVPAEGLFFVDPVFAQHRPADVSPWQNLLLVADLTGAHYPWRHYAARSVAAGRIPLWNPYSACGMPFLANDQSAVLNPTNLILNWLFAPAVAQTIFGLLTLLVASLSTYGLARALGAAPIGAFLAGATYGFSGFIFIWLGYPLAAAAALLPLLLWATYRFAERPSIGGVAAIGAILGWQFVSGHLSTSVQMLAFWAIFAAYEVARRRASEPPAWARRYAGMLCLALALGCGLGAAQLLPLREYYGVSTIGATGRSRWSSASSRESVERSVIGDLAFLQSIALGEIALLFHPEADGHPAFQDYRQQPDYGNYAERTSYPGTLALLALGVALLQMPRAGPRRFFAIAAWVAFAVVLHLPVFNTVTYLPLLRLTAPQRIRFIFSLCAAVSLGFAASDWTSRTRDNRGNRALLLWVLAALASASYLLADRTLVFSGDHISHLPEGLRAIRLAKLFAPTCAAVATAVVFILAGRGRLSPKAMASALVLVALVDLGIFDARWHAMSRADRVLLELPEIRSMLAVAQGGRVNGPGVVFRPNLSVEYGCYDARVYDPISVSRYASLAEAAYGVPRGGDPLISLGGQKPSRLLERLTSTRCRWEEDGRGQVKTVRVHDALPRAYVATNVLSRSGKAALDAVLATGNPWMRTVVEASAPVRSASRRITPAEITQYSPHRSTVRVDTRQSGWLVLTDTCFPGWRASVNGRQVAIAPANYAFRAVPVPSGQSTVTFTYEPASYRIGLFLTCLALCLSGGLIAGDVARERRRKPNKAASPGPGA